MRSGYFAALVIAILVGGVVLYDYTIAYCPAPLEYRLGMLDDEFNLAEEQAIQHLKTAAAVWNAQSEEELLVYEPTADFTVDFVFDDRQARAYAESGESAALDKQREENEEVFATLEAMELKYEELAASYQSAVTTYEANLDTYNAKVQRYNDQGGAPPAAYEELRQEEIRLNRSAQELSERADELNQLGEQINELGERGNQLIEDYNRDVRRYNNRFGYTGEFTQGDYQGDNINIYKFSNEAELITVLTHEFGHALGIGHVEDTEAVMYYLLTDSTVSPQLTEADRGALVEACGSSGDWSQQLSRFVRTIIN